MSKPFDATTKRMVALDPIAWLRLSGVMPEGIHFAQVSLVNVDLSTVTAAADCILRIGRRKDIPLRHFEFESNPKTWGPRRTLFYNVVIGYQTGQPVMTTLILLRPEPRHSPFTGLYVETDENGGEILRFRYDVVRPYEMDPEIFLSGPLATLPLATVCRVSARRFAQVVQRLEQRLMREVEEPLNRDLYMASYVLAGLNHSQNLIEQMMKGLPQMRESVTYQAILAEGLAEGRERGLAEGRQEGMAEGRAVEAQKALLLVGVRRLGEPDQAVREVVQEITSVERLERMIVRLFDVETWSELITIE